MLNVKNKPKKSGYYWAKVLGGWEPVNVYVDKKDIIVIMIGSEEHLEGVRINEVISEFGNRAFRNL